MLSDKLTGICSIDRIVYETDEYLLARVKIEGKPFFAEVTPAEGNGGGKWPGAPGVLLPVNQRGLPDGYTLLLFTDSGEEFLWERLRFETLPVEDAIPLCLALTDILRGLQAKGRYTGYIGPECVLVSRAGRPQLLGGRRGVPDDPFSAPEAIGNPVSDPRSDVFALGSLLFRLVAGTTRERDEQIRVWNSMPDSLRQLIHRMVGEDPTDRFPNLMVLRQGLEGFHSDPPAREGETEEMAQDSPFAAGSRPWRNRRSMLVYVLVAVAAVILVLILLFDPFGPGRTREQPVPQPPPPDTVSTDLQDDVVPDSSAQADTVSIPEVPGTDDTVVWISNCTGEGGAAMDFRTGPASGFSYVYTTTGTTRRSTSVLLLRRTDMRSGLMEQPAWYLAEMLASTDTALVPRPVDLTILLGTDLYYDGVNAEYLAEPAAPAGTLYVDVANNGIQYTLGGMGAATWVASVVDGKSITLEGTEWLVSVVDTRDGDRLSDELGIPELLETTTFLYGTGSETCRQAETVIRTALQALPAGAEGPPEGLRVPDIWILLGKPPVN
jgi:hypothetical protein